MKFCLRRNIFSLLLGIGITAPAMATGSFAENTLAGWVQYTATGELELRAVVTGDCSVIAIDGQLVAMEVRVAATQAHPNVVCSTLLPEGVARVELDGQAMPVPVANPQRIVVVGDTGCRLSAGHGLYQECNNGSLWPFAQVARSIAAYEPDLIIYTGDYIYRESRCPEGDEGCAGSPWGDNLATWEADWLRPAHPLHLAAPLVLIRGNHETCSRAGSGWFRYLDARQHPGTCVENTAPWSLQLENLSLGIMDTATLKKDGESLAPLFAEQLRELDHTLEQDSWLLTHRPFWGYGADDDSGELKTPTPELQDAVRMAGLPASTQLLVGAHIHLAELLEFANDRPPQLVVANGGTQLVSRVEPPTTIDGVDITEQLVIYQYGFVVMEALGRSSQQWDVGFRDIEGRELERCRLHKESVSCSK